MQLKLKRTVQDRFHLLDKQLHFLNRHLICANPIKYVLANAHPTKYVLPVANEIIQGQDKRCQKYPAVCQDFGMTLAKRAHEAINTEEEQEE